jgi:hypothetical protein
MNARTKLTTAAALVATAAFLAPVAQAQHPDDRALKGPGAIEQAQASTLVRPDDRAGTRGPGALDTQSTTVSTSARPDDRAGTRGPGVIDQPNTVSTSTRPDDRAGMRGPGAIEQPTVIVTQGSTGFDWTDAFVGALGGIGTALLLTGGLFLLLGQRTRTRVA